MDTLREAADTITRRRLANQFLTAPGPRRASEVVRSLGAVQAQDYAGAKWGLGQRTRGATNADLERELSDGRILRTHVLRPTWHFVAPADIRWMLALTAPRINQVMSYYNRVLELDAGVFRRANDIMAKALAGGNQLTRAELAAALDRGGVRPTSGQRLGRLVLRAELDAVICSGARRGKHATYALFDERVPPTQPLERDEALRELGQRYFATRGPATPRDFAWWSGLAMADVKRALQILQPELKQQSFGEHEMWFTPGTLPKRARSAHLLPNYDEFFIGYKDRSAVGARIGHTKPVIGGDGRIAHVVFVDGQLVGGWKRVVEKDRVVVNLELWSRLTDDETARITRAAKAYSVFLDAPVEVRGVPKPRRSSVAR